MSFNLLVNWIWLFFVIILETSYNNYSSVAGVWPFLLCFFNVRSIGITSFADASSSNIVRCLLSYKSTNISREPLSKAKAQYSWPSCIVQLRSVPFENANILYYFTKPSSLMRRSTVVSLPLQLVFRAISITQLLKFVLTTHSWEVLYWRFTQKESEKSPTKQISYYFKISLKNILKKALRIQVLDR